ncbi:MAG: protein FxsA [Solirubrobacteraceae bacterium]|nr:protein FxsA [Solirubrobacteraceae bacterium]
MLPLLLLLFIAVPLLELYVILQVGQAIGTLPTIAILVVDSLLGSFLMRSQGRRAWQRFNLAIGEGRVPAREAIDGMLVVFGGALLLTPGFVTDILGAVLLIPFTRPAVRRVLVRRFAGRMIASARTGPPRRPADRSGWDVDGTAQEVDPRPRLQ